MSKILEFIEAEDYHWKNNLEKYSDDHLYFLFYEGTVKIGRAKNVENRMKQLKTGFSKDFKCFTFKCKGFMEKTLHDCFSSFRLNGEWFTQHTRILKFMQKYFEEEFQISEYLELNHDLIQSWKISRGKFKGKTVEQIKAIEPHYLKFILAWAGEKEYFQERDAEFLQKLGKINIPEPISIYIKSILKNGKLI